MLHDIEFIASTLFEAFAYAMAYADEYNAKPLQYKGNNLTRTVQGRRVWSVTVRFATLM